MSRRRAASFSRGEIEAREEMEGDPRAELEADGMGRNPVAC